MISSYVVWFVFPLPKEHGTKSGSIIIIKAINQWNIVFQITCYSHKDDNNKWVVKKAYEDYSEYRMRQSHSWWLLNLQSTIR